MKKKRIWGLRASADGREKRERFGVEVRERRG
jgi:hypothetical protein